jgi:hypothetical protein
MGQLDQNRRSVRGTSGIFQRCLTLCAAGALLFVAGVRAQEPASPASTSQDAKGQTKKSDKKSKKSSSKPQAKPAASPQNVAAAWSNLLQNAIPPTNAGATAKIPQEPVHKNVAGDFLRHFFLQTRTEYWLEHVSFTGNPTTTGVIDVPPTGTFNPNGIPDPSVFQPNTHQIYSFMNWGTNGWLSNRLNTNFTFQYQQFLTHVNVGAPGQNFINTFNGNRLLALVSGYVEINGLPSDGFFKGSSLRLGRQAVYGADLAEFDGASFTFNRPKYSIEVYGGRRFTYFSDPYQRAIGGANFLYRINDNSSFEYDGLFYLNGMNTFTYRRQFRNILFNTHLRMVGSYPVEFVATSLWAPSNGRSALTLSFRQQITNRDYIYDYTYNARDLSPHNPLVRLYLNPISPYTQFLVDYQRTFTPWMELAGGVWIRRLDDSNDQGPFDTSFQDYHVNGRFIPWREITAYLGFHERDSDRLPPYSPTSFFDISHTGETHIRDFTFELGRAFAEGKLSIRGGGFYRVLDFQGNFLIINHAHDQGLLGRAQFQMDPRTQIYVDYDLDSDFFIFAPDIQHAQTLRLGVAWRY